MRASTIPRLFSAARECGSIFNARRRPSAAAALSPLCMASAASAKYLCSCISAPFESELGGTCVWAAAQGAISNHIAYILAIRKPHNCTRIRQILTYDRYAWMDQEIGKSIEAPKLRYLSGP